MSLFPVIVYLRVRVFKLLQVHLSKNFTVIFPEIWRWKPGGGLGVFSPKGYIFADDVYTSEESNWPRITIIVQIGPL